MNSLTPPAWSINPKFYSNLWLVFFRVTGAERFLLNATRKNIRELINSPVQK